MIGDLVGLMKARQPCGRMPLFVAGAASGGLGLGASGR